MLGLKGLVLTFLKRYDLVCKSVGIWDGIVNSIYGCRVRMTPGVNPIHHSSAGWDKYVGHEKMEPLVFFVNSSFSLLC